MNQPSLFDQPVSRRTDPQTSAIGADHAIQISGKLKTRMYEAFLHGPKTAEEAGAVCREVYGEHSASSYRKRSGELEKRGLIRKARKVRCSVTGGMAYQLKVIT